MKKERHDKEFVQQLSEYDYQIKDYVLQNEYEDYYVDIADPANPQKSIKKGGSKTSLPKIDQLLEWGVVQAGDVIILEENEYSEKIYWLRRIEDAKIDKCCEVVKEKTEKTKSK